jgi:hypothetical protein
VGIEDYVQDDQPGAMRQEIQKQFDADGCTVEKLTIFENGNVNLKADYPQ